MKTLLNHIGKLTETRNVIINAIVFIALLLITVSLTGFCVDYFSGI